MSGALHSGGNGWLTSPQLIQSGFARVAATEDGSGVRRVCRAWVLRRHVNEWPGNFPSGGLAETYLIRLLQLLLRPVPKGN